VSADVYAEDGYYAVIPEWVLDADISAQAVRLYAVLRRYADHRSREAHPSRRTLATRMHLADVKAVDRALADLRRIGAVETFERFSDDGDRASNGYRIKARGQDFTQGGGPNAIGGGGAEGMGVGVQKGEEPQPENHSQNNHSADADADFEEFWRAYPRKVGKLAARRAYMTALKRARPEVILVALTTTQWPEDRRFTPHPATWLNGGRWMDESTTPPAPVAVTPVYRTAEEVRAARAADEAEQLRKLQELRARKAAGA
jgi:hypothetical protein